MTATLATTTDLCRFMNMLGSVPDLTIIGSDRTNELIATGSTAVSKYFLDYPNVLTLNFINYGASDSESNTALTSSDYTFTAESGKLILTSTAVTKIGTNKIYASYTYSKLGLTSTQLQDSLNRAQDEIETETGTKFATGTDATPSYGQATNEMHDGLGQYNRNYYLDYYPIPNFSTTLSTNITTATTSLTVASTNGFASSGYIVIGTEKIAYTGKTTTAFTGATVTTAHATAETVYPSAIEISITEPGTTPSWQVLSEDDEVVIDRFTGRVTVMGDYYQPSTYYSQSIPPNGVPNRLRANYLYGYNTIPDEIKRACLMIAAKDLLHGTVRSKMLDGSNGFKPQLVNVDEDWIKQTLTKYRNIRSFNI